MKIFYFFCNLLKAVQLAEFLHVKSNACLYFVQEINEEEGLLEFELTPFISLNNMLVVVEPFHRLWHTVLNFHKQYDKWYYGN